MSFVRESLKLSDKFIIRLSALMEFYQGFGSHVFQARKWFGKGFISIADQALYSGANFILNVLLARWLGAEDYGAFSVAFVILLFLSGLHNALLLEPMSVLGPALYADRIETYLSTQIRLHFVLTVPIALLMCITGIGLQATRQINPLLTPALIGSGLAFPLILLTWTVRRVFYTLGSPAKALYVSILYMLLLIPGFGFMYSMSWSSSFAAYLIIGIASLLSCIPMAGRLLIWPKRKAQLSHALILRDSWNFGKWIVAATILNVTAGQFQTLFLASWLDLEAAGGFRAMQNFMLPMAQAVTAIATFGLPLLASDFGRRDLRSLQKKGLFITLILTTMATAYEVLVLALSVSIEHWFYGGKYAAYAWLIPVLGLVPLFTAMTTGYSLILRAIQKPEHYLISGIVTFGVGLSLSLMFTKQWGVGGAAASLALTYFSGFVVTLYLYMKWFPQAQNKVREDRCSVSSTQA